MNIGLILTICATLAGGVEDCDDYVVETYSELKPCIADMSANAQTRDDRYLSCGAVDTRLMTDKRNGRTVAQIIDDVALGAAKAEK